MKYCKNLLAPEDALSAYSHDPCNPLYLWRGASESWSREVHIFSECSNSSDFVAKFLWSQKLDREGFIVMQLYPLGSLKEYIKNDCIRGKELIAITYCVSQGLEHIHRLGYFHGDIKPSNLLLSVEGIVKICDFGTSEKAKDYGLVDLVWPLGSYTEGYDAPEILKAGVNYKSGEIIDGGICVGSDAFATMIMKRDIYALGNTVFRLYRGNMDPAPANVKPSETDLIQILDKCLPDDVHERGTALEVLQLPVIIEIWKQKQYSKVLTEFITQKYELTKALENCIANLDYKDLGSIYYGL